MIVEISISTELVRWSSLMKLAARKVRWLQEAEDWGVLRMQSHWYYRESFSQISKILNLFDTENREWYLIWTRKTEHIKADSFFFIGLSFVFNLHEIQFYHFFKINISQTVMYQWEKKKVVLRSEITLKNDVLREIRR